jgi:hypothetical protein
MGRWISTKRTCPSGWTVASGREKGTVIWLCASGEPRQTSEFLTLSPANPPNMPVPFTLTSLIRMQPIDLKVCYGLARSLQMYWLARGARSQTSST